MLLLFLLYLLNCIYYHKINKLTKPPDKICREVYSLNYRLFYAYWWNSGNFSFFAVEFCVSAVGKGKFVASLFQLNNGGNGFISIPAVCISAPDIFAVWAEVCCHIALDKVYVVIVVAAFIIICICYCNKILSAFRSIYCNRSTAGGGSNTCYILCVPWFFNLCTAGKGEISRF